MTPEVDNLLERIAAHRVAGGIPREELEWLASHGRLRRLATGEVLTSRAAGVVEGLFLVLSGHIALHVNRANGRERIMEWRGGDVAGLLPYSRLVAPPGDSSAQEPSEIVVIRREDLPALIRECHAFTSSLVHIMIDRARHFTSNDLLADKMASLGKLSAGLAHELNNPASAIVRNAGNLQSALTASDSASRALGRLEFTPSQLAAIDGLRLQAAAAPVDAVRSPVEQADREAEFEDWLRARGADTAHAITLAETAITLPMLDALADSFDGPQLSAALAWLGAGCTTRQLALEIELAASRISTLVDAVKGFTHMDQHAAAGPVNVVEGLSQTLALHTGKARAKGVSVRMEIDADLRPAQGLASEFNQIWANLLDNALDAAPTKGTVVVAVAVESPNVVVRVVDDGPGVPAEIRSRIFDPFFTTKKVGQGTGLGLDIVRRIVQKHRGTITLESQPGRTQFTVALPLASAGVKENHA